MYPYPLPDREFSKTMSNRRQRQKPANIAHAHQDDPLSELHHTLGNQAVQRLFSSGIQTDSQLEIIEKGGTGQDSGKPLAPQVRAEMERGFTQDFSQVRIYDDSNAAMAAQQMQAVAYTTGNSIVFGNGHYAPDTRQGRRLLSHELTHVVQNQISRRRSAPVSYSASQNWQAEQEAHRVSGRLQLGLKAGRIGATNTGVALTPVSTAVESLISYSATDWAVTEEEEQDVLDQLRGDSDLSTTVSDLDSAGMLEELINRVDEPQYRREMLQLFGANLNFTAQGLVEPLIADLDPQWQLQYNLARFGVTTAAPTFDTTPYSHLISGTPSDPFTGAGASGVNPTSLDIPYVDQALLAVDEAATVAEYSNPIPGSLPAYLSGLTATERREQAELLLLQTISSVEAGSYQGNLPSRAQVISAAAAAHRLHPELVAAFLLAEQRDQSRNEDAKDYIGATSILSGNTSIGLGQVVISTASRGDLFADLLFSGTRSGLGHDDIARLLASDEFNIFAAARYIRQVADDGAAISISSLPNTQSTFPNIDMAAYANNSSTWPDDNIRALGSEYTSRAWDDRLSPGWANFVFEAYRDVIASGVFP